MRYALLADIHANIWAAEAAVKDARARGVDKFAILGDIVGYYFWPRECVQLVQSLNGIVVRGNHEDALFNLDVLNIFAHENAREAIIAAKQDLRVHETAYLESLHRDRLEEQVTFTHAAPRYTNYPYIIEKDEAFRWVFRNNPSWVTCGGHTHVPVLFSAPLDASKEDAVNKFSGKGPHKLSLYERHYLNPGSVGKPREAQGRSSYGILDTAARTYEIIPIAYNVKELMRKIVAVSRSK